MQWCWIDRFIEFRSGFRATAVKNISLAEAHLRDHFPAHPVMPGSLVIEGIGQTGMLLAFEAIGYTQLVVLAKVRSARFYREAVPGDVLTYAATIDSITTDGISISATSYRGDRLQGEAELLFARVADPSLDVPEANLRAMMKMMKLLGVFAVGLKADGSRLLPPAQATGVDNAPIGPPHFLLPAAADGASPIEHKSTKIVSDNSIIAGG